jgi:hypothetical protein
MRIVIGSSAAALIIVLLSILPCAAGFLPYQYESPGPYFVRARYISIPLDAANTTGQTVLQGKIYYPALNNPQPDTTSTYYFPPDTSGAPYPVLILQPGANTDLEQYSWLYAHICSYGYIVISFNEIAGGAGASTKNLEALVMGFSLNAPNPTVKAALQFLNKANTDDAYPNSFLLKGMIDTSRLAIGGHSYGGAQALFSGMKSFYQPENTLRAIFTYGVHLFSSTEPIKIYTANIDVPLLDMAGTKAAVGNGKDTTGAQRTEAERVKMTFEQAVPDNNNNNYLLLIRNANHTDFANSADPTVDRSWQEPQHSQNPLVLSNKAAQRIYKNYITAFLKTYVENNAEAKAVLEKAARDWSIADFQTK